jgi:hypothetical protein
MKIEAFQVCWLASLFFLVCSFIINGMAAFDIQLYNIYFVIAYRFVLRWDWAFWDW